MTQNKAKQEQSKPKAITGVDYLISKYKPSVLVDCHMHIQSNNCSPLLFFWSAKASFVLTRLHPSRHMIESGMTGLGKLINFGVSLLDAAGKAQMYESMAMTGIYFEADEVEHLEDDRRHKLTKMVAVSKDNTYKIGMQFLKERRQKVYDHLTGNEKIYSGMGRPLAFPCVVMTMDMEYAHIDGYYGIKVYNPIYDVKDSSKKPKYYWAPIHGRWFKDDRSGKKVYLENRKNPQKFLGPDQSETLDGFKKKNDDLETFGIPGIYFNQKHQQQAISVKAAPYLTTEKETQRYEQWKHQLFRTELVVLQQPLKLLPLFHYDPRRWQSYGLGGNARPFKYVQFGEDEAIYLGFKMYTAQGHRPADFQRLPILQDFYRRCVVEKIPIINHCTPQGAPTFDKKQYIKFRHPMDNDAEEEAKKTREAKVVLPVMVNPMDAALHRMPRPGTFVTMREKKPAGEYFNEEFVSPGAWRKVLMSKVGNTRLDTLRICLAHFGGGTKLGLKWCEEIVKLIKDFDNVYADLSSSLTSDTFKNYFKSVVCSDSAFKTRIRHRILFGTDWYMTLLDGKDYMTYVTEAKTFLDEIHWSLWTRFTMLNPHEFFLLNQRIDRIAQSMINRRQKMAAEGIVDEELGKRLTSLKGKDIDDIQKEAGHIRVAYQPLKDIENSQGRR
jgi:hypothetical protein